MSYEALVLSLSPVGYWPLQETEGTTAADLAETQNGTHQNGPIVGVDGPSDAIPLAVRYDGSNDGTTIPNNADFVGFGAFTLAFWIKILAWPVTGTGNCISANLGTGNQRSWALSFRGGDLSNPNTLGLRVSTTGSFQAENSNLAMISKSALDDGGWHFVAYTRSGTSYKSYLDGELVGNSGGAGGTLFGGSSPVEIAGAASSGFAATNIEVSEFSIHRSELTLEQAVGLYEAGSGLAAPPAVPGNVVDLEAVHVGNGDVKLRWSSTRPPADTYSIRQNGVIVATGITAEIG